MGHETTIDRDAVVRASRKCAVRLLPFLVLMYAISFVDRANVGFAKIAFQADTGLSDAAYAFGAGIFFVGYAIFEVPSNLILHRVGAKVWMSRIMFTWGLVSASMIWAHTEFAFYAIRALLGACEAGFFPGIMLFMTYWFPAEQRARALGLFYFGVPLAMLFGSPISALLLNMGTVLGFSDWQWMFLAEGLAASVVGIAAFFYLDSWPSQAKWLSVEEREALTATIAREDHDKARNAPDNWFGVLANPRVLMFIVIYFCIQIGNAPLAFYLPAKLASTMGGHVTTAVGFLLAIPWLCTIVAMRLATKFADRHNNHRLVATSMLAAGIIAFACLSLENSATLTMIAFCVAIPGLVACQPVFWALPTRYLSGTAAASGFAFITSLGNLGGFVSPQIKAYVDHNTSNPDAGFMVVAALCFVSVILLALLKRDTQPVREEIPAAHPEVSHG